MNYDNLDDVQKSLIHDYAFLLRILNSLDKTSDRDDLKVIDKQIAAKNNYNLKILANKTCYSISNYIDAHVTDLVSAKTFLKELSCIILTIAQKCGLTD